MSSTALLQSVNQVILSLLPYQPTIERVAHAMGFSTRTLQRRLKDVNEDYSSLLAELRHEHACSLLKETRYSIAEVASSLGYKSTSSFCRAFMQWEHVSPADYRKRAAAGSIREN